jgi:hypothetical protein
MKQSCAYSLQVKILQLFASQVVANHFFRSAYFDVVDAE